MSNAVPTCHYGTDCPACARNTQRYRSRRGGGGVRGIKDALLLGRPDGSVRSVPLTDRQLQQFRDIERSGAGAKLDGRVVRSLLRLNLIEAMPTAYRVKKP